MKAGIHCYCGWSFVTHATSDPDHLAIGRCYQRFNDHASDCWVAQQQIAKGKIRFERSWKTGELDQSD